MLLLTLTCPLEWELPVNGGSGVYPPVRQRPLPRRLGPLLAQRLVLRYGLPKIPEPTSPTALTAADQGLVYALLYQLGAVRKALDPKN